MASTSNASREAGAAMPASPPRENVCRAIRPGYELRSNDDGAPPTLVGNFAVFNQWTEINSMWEGNFLERISPGAFTKTFKENRADMRVLFQHGQDPQVGDKPLGPIDTLEESGEGAYYEVPLLDTGYVRDLIPGLEAGLYGASFRFKVMREDIQDEPKPSAYNPRGLPERTIREAKVMEFGPVTFPAYAGASAGIRSITDEFFIARCLRDPDRLAEMLLDGKTKRFDNEDVGTLAEMIALASAFIDEQDEAADADKIPVMEGVVKTLTDLMQGETDEPEPDEPDESGRNARIAPSQPDAARKGTSGRSAADSTNLFWFVEDPKLKGAK